MDCGHARNKSFALGDAVEYENLKIAFVWMGFAIMAVILSWRVDINAFSTHLLYRNRLVRCYLGASVTNAKHSLFTGFSCRGWTCRSLLCGFR